MRANEIKPGDVFRVEGGVPMTVKETKKTSAFKVELEGHPKSAAIMVTWKGPKGDWSLFHPNEDVGDPVRRAKEKT